MSCVNGDFIIRKAVAQDAAAVSEIHMRSWEAAYAGIIPADVIAEKNAGRPEQWRRILSSEHNTYIALLNGRAAGLMGIHACYDEDLPEAGEVGAIYLHPDFWSMGLGRRMMDFALNELKQRGFTYITLWVLDDNIKARRFYERCGFAFDGTAKEIVIGKPLVEVRYARDI